VLLWFDCSRRTGHCDSGGRVTATARSLVEMLLPSLAMMQFFIYLFILFLSFVA